MKTKLTKKMLSLFLAVLMVISALPFTALTASAAESGEGQIASNYGLNVNSGSKAPETFTVEGKYSGNKATNGYNNLAYCSSSTIFPNAFCNKFYTQSKVAAASKSVMIYDGSNDVSSPLVLEIYPDGDHTQEVWYCIPTENTTAMGLKQNWQGIMKSSEWQKWPADNITASGKVISYIKSDDDNNKLLKSFTNSNYKNNTHCFFWNKLYYLGSGNTDTYYEKYVNKKYDIRGTYKSWGSWHHETGNITLNGDPTYYIINYAPLYKILNNSSSVNVNGKDYTFKSLYSEVWTNEWKYTDSTIKAYYQAVKELVDFNLNGYFSGKSDNDITDNYISTIASEIKKRVTAYETAAKALTLNNFTVKFERVNGTSTSQTIVAGNPLSSKFNSIPNLSQTGNYSNNDQKTHRVYSWKTAEGVSAVLAMVVKSDTTFVETPTNVDCSWNSGVETTAPTCSSTGVKTYTCSVCGGIKTESIPMKEHTWGDWYSINDSKQHSRQCSVCKGYDYGNHTPVSANNAVDATCTTDGKESDTVCSDCGQTLTTGATIGANGHSFKNYVSNGDATCTADGTKTAKCDNCDAIDTKADTGSATGHTYAVSGNRYVCTKDAKHIKTDTNTGEEIDLQAYNDTVTEANAELAKTDVYTAESLKDLDDAVKAQANQLDALKDNTQGDVDAKTTAIRTAIGNLELLVVKYNVVFMYQFEGEEAVEVINDSYDKDEEIELKVPEDALAQGVVYKWYTSTTDGAKPYATSVNSTTLIVNKDITIVAKLQKNTTEVESAVKVNLLDKSGKTIAIAYTSASSITLGENSITVDGNEFEAKQIPFYNVKGFKVDGGAAVSSTTYEIPVGVTEINVMPNYVPEKKIAITVSSGVKINGKSVLSYDATWNQAITMTAETEVNWYANGKLIAQGTTYKFCANADVTITAETTAPVTTDPSVEIGYFNYDSSLNKVTVVSNFYAPQGTISDAGVILSTKTSDIETLKKATGGVFKVNSGNFTSNGNQVKISVSRTATTHFTMYALAFVVVDGVTYYADSVSTCVY